MIIEIVVSSTGGIDVDPSKVDVVLQWETHKSFTDIKRFLGFLVTTEGLFKVFQSWQCL